MKQLLILSGKGGTGKTTIAAAFIKLAEAKAYADCDVDAPNLHLVAHQASEPSRSNFYGMPKAEIKADLCVKCDQCRKNCRFDAIGPGEKYKVDPFACEGCGVCEALCPEGAVSLKPAVAGELRLYVNDSVFSTAQLRMGSGTSGKLVTEVKQQMNSIPIETEMAIIDGSPGIGCPVIASLSGADMVLVVAEPSLSGISDMERIIRTAKIFDMKIGVCVNKFDTNIENTKKIEAFCLEQSIPFTGKVPFDAEAVRAVNSGLSIVDLQCAAGEAVKEVFQETLRVLNG